MGMASRGAAWLRADGPLFLTFFPKPSSVLVATPFVENGLLGYMMKEYIHEFSKIAADDAHRQRQLPQLIYVSPASIMAARMYGQRCPCLFR